MLIGSTQTMGTEPRHGYLDVEDGRLLCHECARTYLHLATHVRLAHGLTAAEYREAHGLGVTTALVAPSAAARMSEKASPPERIAHLATIRDPEKLSIHRGRPSWRPETVRRSVERGEAQRRDVPPDLAAQLPPWIDLLAWTAAAHGIVAAGYSINALARAVNRPAATVGQRLRRHPERRTRPQASRHIGQSRRD